MRGTRLKRRWLLAGVGAAAAVAGLGWSLRRTSAVEVDGEAVWQSRFAKPDGGELVMADLRGHPLVLNFWATWCPPCVKEMPELDRFQREMAGRGWQVVGLAVDGPTPVREYLQRVPVGFQIGLAGFDGTDLSRRLGNDTGALPFTAVFDRRGRLVRRKLGQTSFAELAAWADKV
jgi:thiol-disulfide isomerase/thioredoxin